jgi:superfamily II DNA or RNA helicase
LNTLIALPTGMGKTECFIAVLRRALATKSTARAVVLAHRHELIRLRWKQARESDKAVIMLLDRLGVRDHTGQRIDP